MNDDDDYLDIEFGSLDSYYDRTNLGITSKDFAANMAKQITASWVSNTVGVPENEAFTIRESVDDSDPAMEITGDLIVNDVNVGDFIATMQERMCILQADFEKHEMYPALKDAYDQYKMIEKLMQDGTKKD